VEYKTCTTAGCESKYEGAHCPKCKQVFTPQLVAKTLQDRLILVDVDPPLYEQAQRCRCTECKNLFDLSERDVITRAQCTACGTPIFERAQLQKIWKDAETLLQRARKLDRALRQVAVCSQCAQPGKALSWCPLHDPSATPGSTGGLPQNMTLVWVRTFHTAESLEELQQREWLEGETEIETELEEETESENYDA
jgi:hypothetical protein